MAPASPGTTAAPHDTVLPFAPELEETAARYNVWRAGESEKRLARKAALAICERIEEGTREIAAMEADLDLVLGYDRR